MPEPKPTHTHSCVTRRSTGATEATVQTTEKGGGTKIDRERERHEKERREKAEMSKKESKGALKKRGKVRDRSGQMKSEKQNHEEGKNERGREKREGACLSRGAVRRYTP